MSRILGSEDTNPAGYPRLEHSARLRAELTHGGDVLLVEPQSVDALGHAIESLFRYQNLRATLRNGLRRLRSVRTAAGDHRRYTPVAGEE